MWRHQARCPLSGRGQCLSWNSRFRPEAGLPTGRDERPLLAESGMATLSVTNEKSGHPLDWLSHTHSCSFRKPELRTLWCKLTQPRPNRDSTAMSDLIGIQPAVDTALSGEHCSQIQMRRRGNFQFTLQFRIARQHPLSHASNQTNKGGLVCPLAFLMPVPTSTRVLLGGGTTQIWFVGNRFMWRQCLPLSGYKVVEHKLQTPPPSVNHIV